MTMLLVLLTRFTHNIKCQAPRVIIFVAKKEKSWSGDLRSVRSAFVTLRNIDSSGWRQLNFAWNNQKSGGSKFFNGSHVKWWKSCKFQRSRGSLHQVWPNSVFPNFVDPRQHFGETSALIHSANNQNLTPRHCEAHVAVKPLIPASDDSFWKLVACTESLLAERRLWVPSCGGRAQYHISTLETEAFPSLFRSFRRELSLNLLRPAKSLGAGVRCHVFRCDYKSNCRQEHFKQSCSAFWITNRSLD